MILPHQIVGPRSLESPARSCVVLHGILGSKTNWRGIVRRASPALPNWRFVMVDLRNHGDAQGLRPPHTLDAVCDDLAALETHLGHGFDAVLGHSYGAKCALAWVDRVAGALDRAIVVDGNPGARPDARLTGGVAAAVEALSSMGPVFATRDDFVEALAAKGFARDIAGWMAMNLAQDGDAYRLRTDVTAIREMLDDYFARDLWRVIEDPPGRVRVDVVLGGLSPALDASERARVESAAARRPDRVRCVVIERARHWVHVDAPVETVRAVVEALG